jgi:hypothetical protein
MKGLTDNFGWATPRSAGCFFLGALPATVLAFMAQFFAAAGLSRLETGRSMFSAEVINIDASVFAVAGAIGLWIAVFTDPGARGRLNTWASFLIVAGLVADAPAVFGLVIGSIRNLPSFRELPTFAFMFALFLGPFAFGVQYLEAQLGARNLTMRSRATRETRAP